MTPEQIISFIVILFAGVGVFLVGVDLLTKNIEQLATNKIKVLFNKTADKPVLNVGIGALSTALVQSSGVTTVLIVGFVNVGVISLFQATAMIMGANIGTTITAQIAALSAFPITDYIQILAGIGILMTIIFKDEKLKNVGFIVSGFGMIFIGLKLMSSAMSEHKEFLSEIFQTIDNPLLLLFIGIFLTALVQSSSATTSVLISLAGSGIAIGTGGNEILFIILGTNIGSCVTAVMSSLGASTNAKRASLIHLMFNVAGSVLYSIFLLAWPSFMDKTFEVWFPDVAETQIAMFHTFFNVSCTLLFLPFIKVFVKLSHIIIRDKNVEKEETFLDERILASSSIALSQIKKETIRLADVAMGAFTMSYESFRKKDMSGSDATHEQIERANVIGQNIVDYLTKLAPGCNEEESELAAHFHTHVGDLIRITDIADNFTKYTNNIVRKNIEFSDGVQEEIHAMVGHIQALYDLTREKLSTHNDALLSRIDTEEEIIDGMRKSLIDGHIDRLNKGLCKPESSAVFINLVSNLERIGDHLTYIAYNAR